MRVAGKSAENEFFLARLAHKVYFVLFSSFENEAKSKLNCKVCPFFGDGFLAEVSTEKQMKNHQ